MRYLKSQDGALAPIIGLLVLAVVIVAGLAVYNLSQSRKQADQSATPSPTASASSTPGTPTPSPTSDQDQALKEIDAHCQAGGSPAGATSNNLEVEGDAARGNVRCGGANTGYLTLLKKLNGNWTTVYVGQQPAGRTIGLKYNLPDGWYDSTHD